ncbi:MAG: nitric oxide reductase transcriptional regulator NorR, partial [Clostridia bacterium]|nr:nitric oxide reductase transcriptional regulator NorR [Clostridia bacterium]
DCGLPDPFDGLMAEDAGRFQRIHACFGCPLRIGEELIGALTADAVQPDAFEGIDPQFLAAVGALAAAEMHTTLLIEALERSAERQALIARDLMRDAQLRQGTELIGISSAMRRLRQDIDLVARSDFTVLILGETGVGKELVARALHAASNRSSQPMLYVNCAALPESLAESELFGHVRGAFTGATSDRPGKFEVASGGTLFLDEIGELPLSVQPKLLRALQHGEIQRVGSERTIIADVRVIAATNRDLEQEVQAGRFRADLFHRLCVYPLRVPPLRERVEDIPLLAGYFSDVTRRRLGLGPVRLTPDAVDALRAYPWPGNVRELENVISRAVLRAAAGVRRGEPVIVSPAHLGSEFLLTPSPEQRPSLSSSAQAPKRLSLKEATRSFQRSLIQQTLAE